MAAPHEAPGRVRPAWYSAAGNRFALVDLRGGREEIDEAGLAHELCSRAAPELRGERADGVLLLVEPRAGGDLRLVVRNADGGRPETCGNGLRCVGHHELVARRAARSIVVETDAGARTVALGERDGGVHVGLCPTTAPARAVAFDSGELPRHATFVDVGNPHLVFRVADPASTPLPAWAAAVNADGRFPDGCNVEVVATRGAELEARVFERGVGETLSCGSGACAIALAAGIGPDPCRVRFPGGTLGVRRDGGWLWLSGPVEICASAASRAQD